jgi:hypothetical protein
MGRRLLGDRALSGAERQRRRRQRLGQGRGWLLPARRPWDGKRSDNRRESETISEMRAMGKHLDAPGCGDGLSSVRRCLHGEVDCGRRSIGRI